MDETIDFEELIDLNIYFNSAAQGSSQGPISDVLDQMCEALDASNPEMTIISKSNAAMSVPNRNVLDLNTFEKNPADNLFGNDSTEVKEKTVYSSDADGSGIEERIQRGHLKEFECILEAKYLSNDDNKDVLNSIITHNEQDVINKTEKLVANDDVIDLDEFEDILTTQGDNDCEVEDNLNYIAGTSNESGQIVPNDNILDLDEFERFLATEYMDDSNVEVESKYEMKDNNMTNIDKPIVKDNKRKTFLNEYIIDLGRRMTRRYGNETNEPIKAEDDLYKCNLINIERNNVISIVPYEVALEFDVVNKNKLKTGTERTRNEMLEEYIKSDSEDGYNSSDFEFISEEEASKAGLITKSDKTTIHKSNTGTVNNKHKIPSTSISNDTTNMLDSCKDASELNKIKYSKYLYRRCYTHHSSDFHEIPEGEKYLDMFRGPNAPVVMNNLYASRNKNIMPAVLMSVNCEDMTFRTPEIADEKYEKHKDDAEKCINLILTTYPQANRRKRRRH